MLQPAAFRRLCVETLLENRLILRVCPAAFRRLCVETYAFDVVYRQISAQPPSGGCVLKRGAPNTSPVMGSSRLQAAVC